MIVSAHSQGTVLAVAALHRLPTATRGNVHLVTYGSPIGMLYAKAFPSQYPGLVQKLVTEPPPDTPLSGDGLEGALASWRNFYRMSDPIGSTIDELGPATSSPSNIAPRFANAELADPLKVDPGRDDATGNDVAIPLEWDRSSHDPMARHSSYLADPNLRQYVAARKAQ